MPARPAPGRTPRWPGCAAEATSTAEVTCSRWRCAIVGWPYRAKITSPCSVTLNRPSTAPAAGPARRGRRPAAAAEGAAPAVEQRQRDAVRRRPAGEPRCVSYSRSVALTGPSSLAESE